jgi:uncharacterized protein
MSKDPPAINYYRSSAFDCDKSTHPHRSICSDRNQHQRLEIERDRLNQHQWVVIAADY